MEDETKKSPVTSEKEIYKDEATLVYATKRIKALNDALTKREQGTLVTNGIKYSDAYVENQKRAINYAPKKEKGDRKVSYGIPHEKIIAFCAIFLKYVFKRKMKVRNKNGTVIKGLGNIYDLAIEFSQKMERFKRLIALIYWELFSQGNAFVYEDWEVRNEKDFNIIKDGKPVNAREIEKTFEILDQLDYEEGETYQTRRAVSRLLDGRNIIFENPEIEDVQDQPTIWLEFEYTKEDAEAMFGSLSMWDKVPKNRTDITTIWNADSKVTLFDDTRLSDPDSKMILHIELGKSRNRYNLYLNGVMLLPMKTPFKLMYPRNNYPITNFPAERLSGSIYSRGIPVKTKFNSDYIDFVLQKMTEKFEQGVDPALLVGGKYVLTKDIFKAGQRTHSVKKTDYEKADPDNKGITNNEVTFATFIKQIIEQQTVNATTSGEISGNATATEIATLDQNQRDKLGYLLDGLVNGFTDLYLRRAETIESKYTVQQDYTIVDGEKVPVYQNFAVSISGIENNVTFDPSLRGRSEEDINKRNGELFEKSFKLAKKGEKVKFYEVDPEELRKGDTVLDVEVYAEKVKDSQLQMIGMWEEFTQMLNTFGRENVNMEELKKEYLDISNRSDNLFNIPVEQRQQIMNANAMGGQPSNELGGKVSVATKKLAMGSATK